MGQNAINIKSAIADIMVIIVLKAVENTTLSFIALINIARILLTPATAANTFPPSSKKLFLCWGFSPC